jgi:SAM-dependent methyltransferase
VSAMCVLEPRHCDLDDTAERYYESHAEEYFRSTVTADVRNLWSVAEAEIVRGGTILDVGSGSGRDVDALNHLGFKCVGIDISFPLARLSLRHFGIDAVCGDMRKLPFRAGTFDGIWAVASFLHLSRAQLPPVLNAVTLLLKRGGVLVSSMKVGSGSTNERDGRSQTLVMPRWWVALQQGAGLRTKTIETVVEYRTSPARTVPWVVTVAERS